MPSHPSTQNIKVAVDAIIFTIKDQALHVLLIQMKKPPYTNLWAVPGGLIEEHETTEEAASRILNTQTSVHDVYLEQLMTFDQVDRDPAGRVISIGHFALLPSANIPLLTTDKYLDVKWWPVKKLPKLAYDHDHMVKAAIERLTGKIQYTNIVWSLLPKEFTLTQLQQVYEIILGKPLDKRNFRKRIQQLNFIKPTGKEQRGGAFRPAALYTFKHKKLEYLEI